MNHQLTYWYRPREAGDYQYLADTVVNDIVLGCITFKVVSNNLLTLVVVCIISISYSIIICDVLASSNPPPTTVSVCVQACVQVFTAALNNYPHKPSALLYLPDSFSLWAAQPEVWLLVSVRLCHEICCWESWSKQTEPCWSWWPLQNII